MKTDGVQWPETALSPEALPCDMRGVALWKASLSQPKSVLSVFHTWLDDAEQKRAANRASIALQQRAITSRALLRWVLAREQQCTPQALAFAAGEHGKPSLISDHRRITDFNLSHSGQHLFVGVVRATSAFSRIGVDLEQRNRRCHTARLAERVLTENEYQTLDWHDSQAAHTRFLRYWTLKEALSKALGQGFALGFNRVELDLPFEESRAPCVVRLPMSRSEPWRMRFVDFGEGMIAAVAVSEVG
jgi:Phosphopantetheinyl transferase